MKEFFQMLFEPESSRSRRFIYMIMAIISALMPFFLLFTPLCKYPFLSAGKETHVKLLPFRAFSLFDEANTLVNGIPILSIGAFAFVMLGLLGALLLVTVCAIRTSGDELKLKKSVKNIVIYSSVVTAVYFVASFVVPIVSLINGIDMKMATAYIPLIFMLLTSIFYAVFSYLARYSVEISEAEKELKKNKKTKRTPYAVRSENKRYFLASGELIGYLTMVVALALTAMLTNILTVDYDFILGVNLHGANIKGIDMFRNYQSLDLGGQIISFILFVFMTTMLTMFFLSVVAFLSRSRVFAKIAISSLILSVTVCFFVGMFGKYYQIIQKINDNLIQTLITNILGTNFSYSYTITSNSFYYFVGAIAVLAIVLIRKPYSKVIEIEEERRLLHAGGKHEIEGSVEITELPEDVASSGNGGFSNANGVKLDFVDPCPAFTELDNLKDEYKADLDKQMQQLFEQPTLPKLVQFIVSYARDSRLHLSYSPEDIATFIAGLGTTKLSILQGMSGTGKTSLPKIFTEALYSRCEIIEVESSWRDKNELLGYYNEFSKTYTPKKFTQALYRAKLNPETLTFIVLDEMNLSRIEYYFSDFLSLMENEPDKREIKLLNVSLFRTENGKDFAYNGLTAGHTLKIPKNVWFIGTANRDESTFEISDKVYDRANTMNFNKRAPKVTMYNQPIPPKFLPAEKLDELFENAKKTFKFDIDSYPAISEVEKLLAPYNISFGNRIAMQIESFVSIYCSCFLANDSVIHAAVENILLSKVVAKLELKSVDNKEQLSTEFSKLGFKKCADFIMKLNED